VATTMFFEETLTDHGGKGEPVEFEFGRSSFYGENLLYFVIDGKTVIVSAAQGRRICEAMASVGSYLGYDG
jgi:hypothetical protein